MKRADPLRETSGRDEAAGTDGGREQAVVLEFLSEAHPSAFWQVWEAHRRYLYALCLRHMGGVREEAEDALSRAMLKAHEKIPRHAAEIANLKAWLTRLVYNLCIDIHRERRRSISIGVEVEQMTPSDEMRTSKSCKSPEELLLSREVYSDVIGTVEELPKHLREPFVLRFFEEMAYPDIAEKLRLTQENVRKRIQLARAIIQERLDGQQPTTDGLRRPTDY
jgi:RNA polymerase sigma factor (sigma-70 family)